jgi:phosphoribosylformylglycinamidine cyclo-ligase
MIQGKREGYAFDLVATCVGKVPLDRILIGAEIADGDTIIGLASSGIHSNGLTLARRVFFETAGWTPDRYVPEFGRTVGEELLEPTRIYVREVREMIDAGLRVKALAHITSTGFLNLSRATAPVGYVLDTLPETPAIFRLLQQYGSISDADMYFTYNMGIGFCVVIAPEDVDAALAIARKHNSPCSVIGHAVSDPERKVLLPSVDLVGSNDVFEKQK